MKISMQLVLSTITLSVALLVPRCSAYPMEVLFQNHPIALKPSKMPYRIMLSLNSNPSNPDRDIPPVTVSLVNPTQHTLIFRWTSSRDVVFNVEYKAMADKLNGSSGWKQLIPKTSSASNTHSQTDAPSNGVISHGSDYSIVEEILPGQQFDGLTIPLDFSLSKPGFYRITAVMKISHAAEFDGATVPSTLVLSSNLDLHSLPLIIRRDKDGFTQVDKVTSKLLSLR